MKRRNRMAGIISPSRNGDAKVERRPISDKSKLTWERFIGPLQNMAANANAALQNSQNTVARLLIEQEGLNADEWMFDADRLELVKKPPEPVND